MSKTVIELQREHLDDILRGIEGVDHVYYQPPTSMHLKYPCILYKLSGYDKRYANGGRYISWPEYDVTIIDYNPESILQKRFMDLGTDVDSNCYVQFNRFFTADNLNHWSYRLTFTKDSW
jgi:hypothetical protein